MDGSLARVSMRRACTIMPVVESADVEEMRDVQCSEAGSDLCVHAKTLQHCRLRR